MAEEVKETEKNDSPKSLKALFKVLLGLVFLAVGLILMISWRADLLTLIKGALGPFLLLAGVITLAIAKE